MKPIEKLSIAESVITEVQKLVLSGEYKVGDKLPPETTLSSELRVGRSSIREALRYVQALGLIEIRPGKGYYVARTEAQKNENATDWFLNHAVDVQDILEVRLAIEPAASRLASNRRSKSDLGRIKRLNEQFKKAMGEKNVTMLVKTDEAFHSAIMKASKNKILMKFHQSLINHYEAHRVKSFSVEAKIIHSLEGHQRIVDALEASDPDMAEMEMKRHIQSVSRDIAQTMHHPAR